MTERKPLIPEAQAAIDRAGNGPRLNTDRELWRERKGDFYADSLHVTEDGGIGMNVGGTVIVMPILEWHRCADRSGWHLTMETAPRNERILAIADGNVRVVMWGKASHISIYGWCLADQGVEDFDICHPTHWMPLPIPPRDHQQVKAE